MTQRVSTTAFGAYKISPHSRAERVMYCMYIIMRMLEMLSGERETMTMQYVYKSIYFWRIFFFSFNLRCGFASAQARRLIKKFECSHGHTWCMQITLSTVYALCALNKSNITSSTNNIISTMRSHLNTSSSAAHECRRRDNSSNQKATSSIYRPPHRTCTHFVYSTLLTSSNVFFFFFLPINFESHLWQSPEFWTNSMCHFSFLHIAWCTRTWIGPPKCRRLKANAST